MNRSDHRLVAALLFLAGTILLLLLRPAGQNPSSPVSEMQVHQAPVLQFLQSESETPTSKPVNTAARNRALLPELDFESHADQLRKQYGNQFTVIVEKPFIVIGDGPAQRSIAGRRGRFAGRSRKSRRLTSKKSQTTSSTFGCSKINKATKRTQKLFSVVFLKHPTDTTRQRTRLW